jgi:hypothetical protein
MGKRRLNIVRLEGKELKKIEKEISVEDTQKIVDANEKLVKGLKDGTNTISK